MNVAVDADLTVERGHAIGADVHRQEHLPFLSRAIVHVDPISASGETHHFAPAGHHH